MPVPTVAQAEPSFSEFKNFVTSILLGARGSLAMIDRSRRNVQNVEALDYALISGYVFQGQQAGGFAPATVKRLSPDHIGMELMRLYPDLYSAASFKAALTVPSVYEFAHGLIRMSEDAGRQGTAVAKDEALYDALMRSFDEDEKPGTGGYSTAVAALRSHFLDQGLSQRLDHLIETVQSHRIVSFETLFEPAEYRAVRKQMQLYRDAVFKIYTRYPRDPNRPPQQERFKNLVDATNWAISAALRQAKPNLALHFAAPVRRTIRDEMKKTSLTRDIYQGAHSLPVALLVRLRALEHCGREIGDGAADGERLQSETLDWLMIVEKRAGECANRLAQVDDIAQLTGNARRELSIFLENYATHIIDDPVNDNAPAGGSGAAVPGSRAAMKSSLEQLSDRLGQAAGHIARLTQTGIADELMADADLDGVPEIREIKKRLNRR